MSDNYYDRTSNWVFDSDGNYLYSKRGDFNPNIEREGYWYTNTKEWEKRYQDHLKEESERDFETMWRSLENDIKKSK